MAAATVTKAVIDASVSEFWDIAEGSAGRMAIFRR
jgi:hypothetical protein